MKGNHLRKRGHPSLLISIFLVCTPFSVAVGQEITMNATTHNGEAAVIRATVLGVKTSVSDTGSVAASGGEKQSSVLTFDLPGLAVGEVAHATVFAKGNVSASEASMANLRLTVGGNIITSNFLAAHALAKCTSTGVLVNADPNIIGLSVNGQPITISGKPNETITLPNGRIIINEQAKTSSSTSGQITLAAIHVIVNGIADLELSEANAGISCPSGSSPCTGDDDFTTGGGFITGTPSRAKANFGAAGGFQENGELFGHLEFIDHGPNGSKVHGTSVTRYTIVSTTMREIDGTATVNGRTGFTYHVVATDGDPSGPDSFSIQLSNGYSAGGNLVGGHIEIHKDCDSDND